jgi:hypothetical protein
MDATVRCAAPSFLPSSTVLVISSTNKGMSTLDNVLSQACRKRIVTDDAIDHRVGVVSRRTHGDASVCYAAAIARGFFLKLEDRHPTMVGDRQPLTHSAFRQGDAAANVNGNPLSGIGWRAD